MLHDINVDDTGIVRLESLKSHFSMSNGVLQLKKSKENVGPSSLIGSPHGSQETISETHRLTWKNVVKNKIPRQSYVLGFSSLT